MGRNKASSTIRTDRVANEKVSQFTTGLIQQKNLLADRICRRATHGGTQSRDAGFQTLKIRIAQ